MHEPAFQVDQRLQVGSERATVRYIGPVDEQSGQWVGVEWDNEARGKHDGSANGRRYFHCIYSGTAGSFVRLEKLQQTARAGVSVLQGLRARYQSVAGAAATSRFALVGEQAVRERQCQLQLLEKASLSGDLVSSPGPDGELAGAAPALAELDLSGTLVASWRDGLAIARQLPALRQLDLSRTRLALPAQGLGPGSAPSDATGSRLRTLILNECSLSWTQVLALSGSLGELRKLFLCGNGIVTLAAAADAAPRFQQLQVLDLSCNSISDWGEVCHLNSLPSLTTLNLSSNQLEGLASPLNSSTAFSALQALLCAGNRIGDWATVQSLATLPALCDVRLSGNLLFTSGGGERFEVIARMPGLTFLNGSTVDALERRDSELHYLRGLLAQIEERPAQLQALEAAHPQLAPLREKYGLMAGTLARSRVSQGGTPPMATGMLTLHLIGGGDGAAPVKYCKPVPGCITLKSLKYIMAWLLQVPMPRQQLAVRSPAAAALRSLGAEDEAQTLAELAFEDHSEVHMQPQPGGEHLEDIRRIQTHLVSQHAVQV